MVRWRIIVTANSLPIVILIILVLIRFIPESPNSLILKNRNEEAKKVIGLFHQSNFIEEIYQHKLKELTNIEKNFENFQKKNKKLKTFLTF
jgi:ABC-type dipeptide/oligopeptide/nickel transport system permease component